MLRKLSVLVTVMLQNIRRLVLLIGLYRYHFRGLLKAFPWDLVICLISCSSVWSAPDAYPFWVLLDAGSRDLALGKWQ